jgi:hypothetical protein
MDPCIFCGSDQGEATEEHVIPKWARRAVAIESRVSLGAVDRPGADRRHVGYLPALNITLNDAICGPCNSVWLSGIETRVAPVLKPMLVSAQPVTLDRGPQSLLAFWAVKTGLLLELAIRQMDLDDRRTPGYAATVQELAWLRHRGEPPPRSMVWLGAWDCERRVPVNYEPSGAELPCADGGTLAGHMTTFSLGFVAFQVFTVDFVAAEARGARVWNWRPEPPLREWLPRIWPQLARVAEVAWPPALLPHGEWHRMVTWDGRLRPWERPPG